MRASLALAVGLFATNIVVLELRQPKKPTAPRRYEDVHDDRHVIDGYHASDPNPTQRADAQRLAWIHTARRAGFHPLACGHDDPLATLDADVDQTPGREHVIGNRRHGVAMFSEHGALLAYMHPVGCADPSEADQSLSLGFDSLLILRARDLRDDGEHFTAHLARREGDELVDKLTVDIGGWRENREADGKIYVSGNSVEVRTHGRELRRGRWEAVDEHCTYDLATRSSSCRRPAEERTSRSE